MNNSFSALRSFKYRDYRLFFIGQGVSLSGTWMQMIAMSWLVYRLTNSPFMLGLVAFSNQIPMFLLSPFAGVLVDRYDKRKILIITQSLAMLQAFALAALTLAGIVQVWHIITLGIILGCVNAVDMPARHSLIARMVKDKDLLGNAIALNSIMFNVARLVGPPLAGILIATTGEGICFLINGFTFFSVIAALLLVKVSCPGMIKKGDHLIKSAREGIKYAVNFTPIRYILALLAVTSTMGMSYTVLMPIFAKEILMGGPDTLGFLMAASGGGALLGSTFLALRKNVNRLENFIPLFSCVFSLGLIIFALSNTLWLSLPILAVMGTGIMIQIASSNIVLQTIVDDDKRGRIMSLYTMSFLGMAPFGSLAGGILASSLGTQITVIIGGISTLLASWYFAHNLKHIKAKIRPLYLKHGILSDTDTGMPHLREMEPDN